VRFTGPGEAPPAEEPRPDAHEGAPALKPEAARLLAGILHGLQADLRAPVRGPAAPALSPPRRAPGARAVGAPRCTCAARPAGRRHERSRAWEHVPTAPSSSPVCWQRRSRQCGGRDVGRAARRLPARRQGAGARLQLWACACVAARARAARARRRTMPRPEARARGGAQVELVARGHQVLALPMLGAALGWRDRVAGVPTAAQLTVILAGCCERLLALLQRYTSEMVRAARRGMSTCTLRAGPVTTRWRVRARAHASAQT